MNYLLKHVTEGKIERKIEVTGRRERRRKQLLQDKVNWTGHIMRMNYLLKHVSEGKI
jgi:hypothetical protein